MGGGSALKARKCEQRSSRHMVRPSGHELLLSGKSVQKEGAAKKAATKLLYA
jgi:hypothetical protein